MPGFDSQPPEESRPAIRAWQLMGNAIEWGALEIVAELLGIDDVEVLILELAAIRDTLGEDHGNRNPVR